jgi:pyridoxamine 5'-phosphate oxidase
MCLATSTPDGQPSARMVLLKDHDARGFVFYTNLESRKGGELAANPHAALCFHWKTLARSVRVEGAVEPVSEAEADAYYASRSRGSRIGAGPRASPAGWMGAGRSRRPWRSSRLSSALGEIPRPPHWSGFRLLPVRIEFWRDMPFRLHERRVFLAAPEGGWATETLFP